jgi:hypothetical protein
VLNGNPITLGGDIVDNQFVTLQTINLSLALGATRNVDVTADGALTIGGVISGAGGPHQNRRRIVEPRRGKHFWRFTCGQCGGPWA